MITLTLKRDQVQRLVMLLKWVLRMHPGNTSAPLLLDLVAEAGGDVTTELVER